MALVVADRVQETTTTSGTGTLSLAGAVAGYRSFVSGIGSTNTTYYVIYDQTAQVWEVGIGTVTSGLPDMLSRDTVLSNSSGNTSPINLAGNSAVVFCSYPAEKSVNLNASGNVTALGTISSGTWNGTTIGVAYGGTGVTTSSGANSVVLRDANQNITINRLSQGTQTITVSGGTTTLTAASAFSQVLNGTGNQTFKLPDATTLTQTTTFEFNNNATGTLTITDNAGATVGTISSGGAAAIALLSNSTVGGTWDVHAYIPENVTWGTNSLALGSTVITGGTWNGGTIASGYGGTGLTTFTAANYALYSTSASALTAGTLPVAAGGTGQTAYTDGQLLIGNSATSGLSKATLTAGTGVSITNGNGSISISATGSGGTVTSVSGTGTVNGITLSGTVTSSGNLTLGGTLSGVSLTTQVTGTLPVANGGTGLTSGTSGGVLYYSATGTLVSSAALASNALVVGGGAGVAPSTITTGTGVVTALGNATNATGGVVTVDGTATLTNKTLTNPTVTNYTETAVTANTGTSYTIDITAGTVQVLTLTGNCTFTFPSASAGKSFILLLKQDATGGRTATWPAAVKWPGGTAPTITSTASKLDKFVFTSDGTNWYGSNAGQNYTV